MTFHFRIILISQINVSELMNQVNSIFTINFARGREGENEQETGEILKVHVVWCVCESQI